MPRNPSRKCPSEPLLLRVRRAAPEFVCVVLIAGLAGVSNARAQTGGVDPRIRVTVSANVTVSELAAMLAASEVTNVPTSERTITLRGRDSLDLVVPAPGTIVIGVIVAVDDRRVLLESTHEGRSSRLTIPRAAILKVDQMAGRRSRARYAGVGALLGFGAGALIGLASVSCEPNEWFCSPGLGALGGAIVGTTSGAVTGAIIPPAVRWMPIDPATLHSTSVTLEEVAGPSQATKVPRFTCSVQTGQPWSGPASDVEAAMRASGFADTSPGFAGPPIRHPFSRTGFWEIGAPFMFGLNYAWNPSWSVGFLLSQTPIGETFGYRSPGLQYLQLQYRVTTTGVVVSRHYRFVAFGGGPALHEAQARQDAAPGLDPGARHASWSSDSHVGLIGLVDMRLPRDTRVYLDLGLQYRYVGRASFGPFTPISYGTPATTLPASDVQFSHWFVAFGPGVRF